MTDTLEDKCPLLSNDRKYCLITALVENKTVDGIVTDEKIIHLDGKSDKCESGQYMECGVYQSSVKQEGKYHNPIIVPEEFGTATGLKN